MARGNHIPGLFARMAQRDMRSESYKALGPWARCAILELDLYYWETGRQNPLVLTQRWLAAQLSIDPKTAAKILEELEAHGFLELLRFGKMTGPTGERGALYRMTWQPTNDGMPASFENRGWMAKIPSTNVGKSTASTGEIVPFDAGRKGSERTTFRDVGPTAKEALAKVKAQRNQGHKSPLAAKGTGRNDRT